MTFCLFGTKLSLKPMLSYSWLDPWEQISMKLVSRYKNFNSRKLFENVICKMQAIVYQPQCVNSLWPSDIWHLRFWSKLVQVLACSLMAPSHYLNQCCHTINMVLWQLWSWSALAPMAPDDIEPFLQPMLTYIDKVLWLSFLSNVYLLLSGNKPLLEPILTFHQWGPVTIIWEWINKRYLHHQSL